MRQGCIDCLPRPAIRAREQTSDRPMKKPSRITSPNRLDEKPGAAPGNDAAESDVESRTVKLRILDRSVQLGCRSDQEEDLLEAAAYVDASMRDLRARNASSSLEKIAVVAAINLAGDLLKARRTDGEQVALGKQLKKVNDDIAALLDQYAATADSETG